MGWVGSSDTPLVIVSLRSTSKLKVAEARSGSLARPWRGGEGTGGEQAFRGFLDGEGALVPSPPLLPVVRLILRDVPAGEVHQQFAGCGLDDFLAIFEQPQRRRHFAASKFLATSGQFTTFQIALRYSARRFWYLR